jgi:hypothetical protein
VELKGQSCEGGVERMAVVSALSGGSVGEVEARQEELWTMIEQCEECRTLL